MTRKSLVVAAPGHRDLIDSIPHGHPIDGPLRADGSYWTEDHFTARMLIDGVIVRVEGVPMEEARSSGPETMFKPSRRGG